MARAHHVPSAILQLKASDDPSSQEYIVTSVPPLPRGSSFGPFKGVVRAKIERTEEKEQSEEEKEFQTEDGSALQVRI